MKKKHILPVLLAGFAYRVLCGTQGIDCVDTGFGATFYQNILSSPDALIFNYIYYTTGLIGGLWYSLFGNWGLMGLRVLEAFTLTCCIGIMYSIYRHYIKSPGHLLFATAISFVFPYVVSVFHYNTVTYFLIALSAWLFDYSNRHKSLPILFLAGIPIGIAFFARIVNLSLLILCIIPLFPLHDLHNAKKKVHRAALLCAGMLTGTAATIYIMYLLGHFEYFGQALGESFSTLGNGHSSHSSGGILRAYAQSALNVILQISAIVLCLLLYKKGDSYTGRIKKISLTYLAFVIFVVLAVTNPAYLPLVALCLILNIGDMLRKDMPTSEIRTLMFLIAAALAIPLGSDAGIPAVFHWTVGLLVFPACRSLEKHERPTRTFLAGALSLTVACALCKTALHAYGSDSYRYELTETISPQLNVMETKEKAAEYRKAIKLLKEYAEDNPYLVLANHQTQLYFATGLKPLLGHTETHFYHGEALLRRLRERSELFNQKPTIAFINSIGYPKPDTQRTLLEYISCENYHIAYQNKDIIIYTP